MKDHLNEARIQLDHAESEVTRPDAGGVNKRLAKIRALLQDGHRLLQETRQQAVEDQDMDLATETAVEPETESTRERTARGVTPPRI